MSLLVLSYSNLVALGAIAFFAGAVRGFTGFALSAIALALAVMLLPPVDLIPVLWWLEMGASLMLLTGTARDADWGMTSILVVASACGVFAGLSLTTTIDPNLSRILALVILITLAALQLVKLRLPALESAPGQALTGLAAGLVTGVAGVGGMVIALFVLAQNKSASVMRASMITFLFLSSFTSLFQHLWFGTMTQTAVLRGLVLLPPCLIGVWLGKRLFVPKYQHLYRPICLGLLIILGAASLIRSLM